MKLKFVCIYICIEFSLWGNRRGGGEPDAPKIAKKVIKKKKKNPPTRALIARVQGEQAPRRGRPRKAALESRQRCRDDPGQSDSTAAAVSLPVAGHRAKLPQVLVAIDPCQQVGSRTVGQRQAQTLKNVGVRQAGEQAELLAPLSGHPF